MEVAGDDSVVEFSLVLALGVAGPAVGKVFILECASTAAVIPAALTIAYANDVTINGITALEHLSTTIFTTTVASIGVLAVLIAVLQSGEVICYRIRLRRLVCPSCFFSRKRIWGFFDVII